MNCAAIQFVNSFLYTAVFRVLHCCLTCAFFFFFTLLYSYEQVKKRERKSSHWEKQTLLLCLDMECMNAWMQIALLTTHSLDNRFYDWRFKLLAEDSTNDERCFIFYEKQKA